VNSRQRDLEESWLAEGYTLVDEAGFVPAIARVFWKPGDPYPSFRAVVTPQQCNRRGTAHGGFLAAMADTWLARTVGSLLPPDARFVTASLAVDFLRPVEPGAWIESEIDRVKIGARLCHASGAITSAGQDIAVMRATFARIAAAAG